MTAPARSRVTADERLLTTREIADLFRVDIKTVTRWGKNDSRLNPIRTPGGRYRYRESEVLALLNGDGDGDG
jgi:predicted site-specific integrase-resolvase